VKLKKEFLVHDTGTETVLVPTAAAGFSGVARGNRTFGAVLGCLKNDVTQEEIVEALRARFDAPEGAIEADVERAVSELRGIGALDEQLV
jgi:hypothetical protein